MKGADNAAKRTLYMEVELLGQTSREENGHAYLKALM